MRVVLYARVSTGRQYQNDLSVPDQLRSMHEWATSNGHQVVREYVEAGRTATSDDKRPEFQRMMADSALQPRLFEGVVVHSQSRFYRNPLGFLMHVNELEQCGIQLFSITQPSGNDPVQILSRQIMSVFDGYSSLENSKHTHRAMCQNARMGYCSSLSRHLASRRSKPMPAERETGSRRYWQLMRMKRPLSVTSTAGT